MLFPKSTLHTAAAALCGDEIIHFTLSYVFLACLLLVIPFLLKKYEIAQCQSVVDETTSDDPLPTLVVTQNWQVCTRRSTVDVDVGVGVDVAQ